MKVAATEASHRLSQRRRLYVSNGADIAGRSLADYVVDVVAVTLLGASALQMGLLNILQTLPIMLLAVPIGVAIDRSPSVRPLMASQLARAFLVTGLVTIAAFNLMSMAWLAAFVVLSGILATIAEAGQGKAVPSVANKEQVGSVYSTLQAVDSAAGVVVPAGAGILLAVTDVPVALAISAALALVGGLALAGRFSGLAREAEPAAHEGQKGLRAFASEARDGMTELWRNRRLRLLTAASFLLGCGLAAYSAVEAIYVLRDLGVSVAAFGFIVGSGAIGGLLGSVVSGPFVRRFGRLRLTRLTFICTVVCGMLLFLPLLEPAIAVPVLVAQFFLWGLFVVANNIQVSALVVESVREHVIGRVIATRRALTMASILLGSVVGGALGTGMGTAWVLALFVALLLGATVAAFRIREGV